MILQDDFGSILSLIFNTDFNIKDTVNELVQGLER